MTETLVHHHHGRNIRTALALLVAIALLSGLHALGTVNWILYALGIFAVPAAVDLIFNPTSTFEMDESSVRWNTPVLTGDVPLERIEMVRFDTRWDVSVRATLILHTKKRIRIPHDACPPHKALEAAFEARGIKTERHHFRVI